ncbi:hypothetical protein [Solwaraspora sp. WMMD792]|uniref:hypothetical protein n=1 Tax=Solwaraspora sp. WMMD792 TaxID=3016099 RepID=UPI002416C6E8|nr:hypothetical protein [Solwaraspora sp. WMMD792]MDG4771810.1 hypothetical protein [Solwaraspora sp. WMMD792]
MSYPYGSEDAQYRAPATPAPTYPTNAYPPAPPPPTPAPPTATSPAYGPPTPAPPTSGPPTSGPPGYGPPTYPQVPPPAPKGRATLVLAVLSVLLLALGAVGFGLYFNERGELRDTRSDLTTQLQEQRDIVAERDERITETETRVGELTSELDTTKENLAGVTEERDVLLPCMRRAQEMFDAARAGDEDKLDAALRQADTACSRAQAGVDS